MISLRTSRLVSRAMVILSALTTASIAEAGSVVVTVDSHAGPWSYGGGLNTGFEYGIGDYSAPLVVGAADGFDFSPGGSFTIEYLSGLTSPFGGTPYADGIGDTGYDASGNGGSSGNGFPSLYINPASYPAYLNALIGTFADDSGAIVGTPFLVGNLATVIVPAGATRLQLGLNDDIFGDNTGFLVVQVSGPGLVPEPSTFALAGTCGLAGLAALARRRRAQAAY